MKKILLTILVTLFLPLQVWAAEITVAAAANVQFALEELKAAFEKESGNTVQTVIGSSGKLTTQIENGAPFHVFLSADTQYPKALYEEGLADGEPKVYAYGTLVLWTLKDLDLSKETILADPAVKKIAVANPQTAPYGRQAINALKHQELYAQLKDKLVYGESIAQVNQFVTSGAADVGFTAKSVVVAPNMAGKGKWVEVDPKDYEQIAQAAVVLKYSQKDHSEIAHKFYDFIFSASGREILKKYGYILP